MRRCRSTVGSFRKQKLSAADAEGEQKPEIDQRFMRDAADERIRNGEAAKDDGAERPEQRHTALASVKAEACELERGKHTADGGEKLEGVVMHRRVDVPLLKADDQAHDEINAGDHIQQRRGTLAAQAEDGVRPDTDRAEDTERRQHSGQRLGHGR